MAGHKRRKSLEGKNQEHKGQALAEYALIITFIAIVAVGALLLLGGSIQGFFTGFSGSF